MNDMKPQNSITEEQFKTEQQLQKACFDWFDKTYGEPYRGLLYANVMNPKDSGDGNRLKACGMRKGLPDMKLALPLWDQRLAGLYIELKMDYNKPSPDQVKQMRKLTSAGYACTVIKSFSWFKHVVSKWIKEFEEQ